MRVIVEERPSWLDTADITLFVVPCVFLVVTFFFVRSLAVQAAGNSARTRAPVETTHLHKE